MDAATAAFLRFQREGDREQLTRALLQCAPALRLAAVRLARVCDADDLLQECFVIAIRRAHTFDGEVRLLPWLLGILQNVARTRHRRRWARLAHGSVQLPQLEAQWIDRGDVVGGLAMSEWSSQVRAAAEALDEPFRTVVRDHLFDGVPLVVIASRLSRSSNTVRSQFARGLRQLRGRLNDALLAGLAAVLAAESTRAATAVSTAVAVERRRPRAWWGIGLAGSLLVVGWSVMVAIGVPVESARRAAAAMPVTVAVADDVAALPVLDLARREPPSERAPQRRIRLQLRLSSGEPAVGLPVWCDPEFVAGTVVAAVHRRWLRGHSDGDGVVEFQVPTTGVVALRLHELAVLRTVPQGRDDIDWCVTVPEPTRIDVECVDLDGDPIADATIHACGTDGQRSPGLAVARTDADGRARIASVHARTHLWAIAGGYEQSAQLLSRRTSDVARVQLARFELAPAMRWRRGRVVDDRGAPRANAIVAVWSSMARSPYPHHLGCDADGRFATEHLPPGPWSVVAVAPGHASARRELSDDESDCSIVLPNGVDVTGAVRGLALGSEQEVRIVVREATPHGICSLTSLAAAPARDGSFVLRNVPPGNYELGLFLRGSQPVTTASLVVGDAPSPRMDLELPRDAFWRVQVVDERGVGLPGCLVVDDGMDPLFGYSGIERTLTDATGQALLRRPSAESRCLQVHLPGPADVDMVPALIQVVAEPGEPLQLTVPTRQPRALVRGVVPAALRAAKSAVRFELQRASSKLVLAVSADGTFSRGDLPPGDDWHLLCHLADGTNGWHLQLATFDLDAGAVLDLGALSVAPLGSLECAVSPGGADVPRHVALYRADGWRVQSRTIAPGSPSRCELPAGRYRMCIADSSGATEQRQVDVVGEATTRVDLAPGMGQPCRLAFLVRSGSGRGRLAVTVAGASVDAFTFLLEQDPLASKWTLPLDLRSGVYSVRVTTAWGVRSEHTIVVAAAAGLQTFPLDLP